MTNEQIDSAPADSYSENEWNPLVNYFWDRYKKRYFDPIEILQKHANPQIRNNCGFLITTIDCVLIETLEQYYSGTDASKGNNTDPFLSFFQRADQYKSVIQDRKDAGIFVGFVRSGLLHQAKTKKASVINKNIKTPILDWIDDSDKLKGLKLNRDKFHTSVYEEYEKLIQKLKINGNSVLRKNFKQKLKTIIE